MNQKEVSEIVFINGRQSDTLCEFTDCDWHCDSCTCDDDCDCGDNCDIAVCDD